MKKQAIKILLWVCALLAFFAAPVYANVGFTTDGAADPAALYVAGNPDGFPVEGFNTDSGAYVGAAPAFLQLVSERTNLNFVYIRAGEQDRREALVRNHQVDLLFATSEEPALLDLGDEAIKLFSVMNNGVPTDVYCVFTAVSGAEDRAQIRSVAESLTKDELSLLITADSAHFAGERKHDLTLILLGSALLIALAAVAVLSFLFFRFRNKRKKTAFVDTATRIGNKQYFVRTFRTMISDPARELYYVIHFAFDIIWVNNNYGEEEANEILRYAADSITQRMKDNEFCARIGGGAFAAAIYSSGTEQVENRVDEILRVLNAYSGKYKNGEMKLLFHAGICALAIDDKNAEKVLYNAEQAYRRAVEEKSAFVFVNHDVLNKQQARVSIREQAAEALDQHAFTPYVQFIVSAEDGSICGGEMLSRWQNRLYGLLNPGVYVPVLQDMGMIAAHDLLMLEEACKLLQAWTSQGKSWFLTCNLTRITISDPSLVDRISTIAERYSFAREKLILEVTEGSLEEDKDRALQNITSLKEKGFRIALDDFSRGHTSVSNLYEYSVDLVKLDRQMILDADQESQAASLLNEITRLCHELQIRVLAEGVETEQQARQVRTARCDYIQGYYYARPLPLRELDCFEEQYRPEKISADEERPAMSGFEAGYPPKAACKNEEVPERIQEAYAQDESQAEKGETEVSSAETRIAEQQDGLKANHTMLQIQYGPYHLELPGNIDMDSVVGILRAIQDGMTENRTKLMMRMTDKRNYLQNMEIHGAEHG